MKNKIKSLVILIFTLALATFACTSDRTTKISNTAANPNVGASGKQIYKAVGIIKKIDADGGKITIDHEDIPGYMAAMEMTEAVGDKLMLNDLKAGDKVSFELERTGAQLLIVRLDKIGEVALVSGAEIYKANCAECHGEKGAGAKKGISLFKGHALAHSEAEHRAQVRDGAGKKMPAFKDKLTAEEIAAVVKFVREELQKDATPEQRNKHHH